MTLDAPPKPSTVPPVGSRSSMPTHGSATIARVHTANLAPADADDATLVLRMRAGDERSFETIFKRHQTSLLSYCRHVLGDQEEAEDALQQAFIRAHRALLGDSPPRELRPWLYAIARNCCLSAIAARRPTTEPRDDAPSLVGLTDEVHQREDLRDLVSDIARLPEEQRSALLLSELEDLSHSAIAAIVGCPVSKVKALVYQARSTLIAERGAREASCEEIRERLSVARGGELRRGPLRRHLGLCAGCRDFQRAVTTQRRSLAAVLPVLPSADLAARILGHAAATTATAGVGASAAVSGGTGAGAAGGGAAAASTTAAGATAASTGATTAAVGAAGAVGTTNLGSVLGGGLIAKLAAGGVAAALAVGGATAIPPRLAHAAPRSGERSHLAPQGRSRRSPLGGGQGLSAHADGSLPSGTQATLVVSAGDLAGNPAGALAPGSLTTAPAPAPNPASTGTAATGLAANLPASGTPTRGSRLGHHPRRLSRARAKRARAHHRLRRRQLRRSHQRRHARHPAHRLRRAAIHRRRAALQRRKTAARRSLQPSKPAVRAVTPQTVPTAGTRRAATPRRRGTARTPAPLTPRPGGTKRPHPATQPDRTRTPTSPPGPTSTKARTTTKTTVNATAPSANDPATTSDPTGAAPAEASDAQATSGAPESDKRGARQNPRSHGLNRDANVETQPPNLRGKPTVMQADAQTTEGGGSRNASS